VKLWFYLVLLLPISAIAQNVGVRVGDGQPTESLKSVPGVGSNFIVSVPNASISFCQAPANGVPCTNKARTYTDSSLNTACSTVTQIVLSGTNNCVGTTNQQGKWGVWVAPGEYAYTVTANGASSGPYFVTAGGSSGGGISGVHGIVVATPLFGGNDICAQITNAMAALPPEGGIVEVPAGNYPACAGVGGIGIAIVKNSITLQGTGWLTQLVGNGSTTINFVAGVTGIDITGGSVTAKDLNLHSQSASAGTDDGIRVRGGSTTLDSISVSHFGRSGVLTLGNFPTNADSWRYSNMQSYLNYGDGYQWGAPCTDNHLGTATLLTASVNGGWGFEFLCGSNNTIISPLVQGNTLGGYNVQTSWNRFDQAYCEEGKGSSFIIGAGAPNFVAGTLAQFSLFGQCQTISNVGPVAGGNQILYFGADNWQGWNGFYVNGQPGAVGNRSYRFDEGSYANGNLGIYNHSDNQWLFHYDPTTKWHFDQKVSFTPSATLAGLNIGSISGDPSSLSNGDIWYNVVTGTFRCYEGDAVKNCIGSGAPASGGGATVKTVGYTVLSTDAGKVVAFNCAVACTATLTSAAALGPSFGVTLQSFGVGTVTIASSSTINGGITLLKGGSAMIASDGTAFYSTSTKNYAANASNGTSDTLSNPAAGGKFITTIALPANLPVGTRIHLQHSGRYVMSGGTTTPNELAVRDAAGVEYCSGEQLYIHRANGNSGNGKWLADCWITVQTAGKTGNVYGINMTHQWTADSVTVNGIAAGPGYPGYDSNGTRQAQDSETGVTFDDTTQKVLSVSERQTTNNLVIKLEQITLDITLP
jgi:hypothetical protein